MLEELTHYKASLVLYEGNGSNTLIYALSARAEKDRFLFPTHPWSCRSNRPLSIPCLSIGAAPLHDTFPALTFPPLETSARLEHVLHRLVVL